MLGGDDFEKGNLPIHVRTILFYFSYFLRYKVKPKNLGIGWKSNGT